MYLDTCSTFLNLCSVSLTLPFAVELFCHAQGNERQCLNKGPERVLVVGPCVRCPDGPLPPAPCHPAASREAGRIGLASGQGAPGVRVPRFALRVWLSHRRSHGQTPGSCVSRGALAPGSSRVPRCGSRRLTGQSFVSACRAEKVAGLAGEDAVPSQLRPQLTPR